MHSLHTSTKPTLLANFSTAWIFRHYSPDFRLHIRSAILPVLRQGTGVHGYTRGKLYKNDAWYT